MELFLEALRRVYLPSSRRSLLAFRRSPCPRKASVLVPFLVGERGLELLFTLRASGLWRHGGQLSFPGGRMERGESPLECALREAFEEVGMVPEAVAFLGYMRPHRTYTSGYLVLPVLARVDSSVQGSFRPNPLEVSRLLPFPLRELLRLEPSIRPFRSGDEVGFFPEYDLGGFRLWGATARIVFDLLYRAKRRGMDRWAW